MKKTHNIPEKIYMGIVIAAGFTCIAFVTVTRPLDPDIWTVVFLALLAIVAETQTVSISDDNSVSITIAVTICAMLTSGTTAAVWVAALSVLGTFTKVKGEGYRHIFNIAPEFTLFNACSYALGVFAMSLVYTALGGYVIYPSSALETVMGQINSVAVPIIFSILSAVFVNTFVVAIYIALRQKVNLLRIWVSSLLWSVLSLFFVGLLGVIITAVYLSFGWFLVLVFFAPFVLARYVFSIYKDLRENYLQTVMSLAAAIETKDTYTIGHSRRVEFYSGVIAVELNLRPKRCEVLRYAALLHDIGKIGIDEKILHKPEGLTMEEFKEIRQHPVKGAHILEGVEFLTKSAKIIRLHHERFDGTGYPDGLSGSELPLEAMILSVADCYDAMTSDRPYRAALTHEEALGELYDGAGTQFDPKVVQAFDRAMQKRGNKLYVV